MKRIHCPATLLLLLASGVLGAQQPAAVVQPHPTTAAEAPQRDSSYIDAQGTAHVTRVAPVPASLSPQAQLNLGREECAEDCQANRSFQSGIYLGPSYL